MEENEKYVVFDQITLNHHLALLVQKFNNNSVLQYPLPPMTLSFSKINRTCFSSKSYIMLETSDMNLLYQLHSKPLTHQKDFDLKYIHRVYFRK